MIEQIEQPEFIVTARKWRPLLFSDVIGQEHITNTLRNALKSNRLHHAFLFCGPRGVGKTTTARILGRAVNCLNPSADGEPCNECDNCTGVIQGRSLDIIEIDGASNTGVDDIRQLRENAKYPPSTGKYKMYIIDEVHMLSNNAFNALLKILEEPPPHLMFVFATTESHKVPATIVSRCQRYDFRRMELNSIINQLRTISAKEGITIDDKSLMQIAKKADGSMRDSQSIFDQVVSFCGNTIEYKSLTDALHLIDEEFYFRITDCISARDLNEAFVISQDVINKGYEMTETLSGLLEHLRNLLTIKATGDTKLIETSDAYRERYQQTADQFTKPDLLRYIQVINQTETSLRFASQPRIKFELALAQLASMDKMLEVKDLIEEIRKMDTLPAEQSEVKKK
ncbi:MAG: DNA polymerase III subunit gamma/tau [Ignavibacteria bacterium]|nr:DNA polymerase III subunit gamma/tau [Ignavibacteria bacterium]